MGNAMRDRHQPENQLTETDNGDGTSLLECECGWIYTTHEQFKHAVVLRHIQESKLP